MVYGLWFMVYGLWFIYSGSHYYSQARKLNNGNLELAAKLQVAAATTNYKPQTTN